MSDLQSLAKQKVEDAMSRRIAALPAEIETIKRENAAKGLVHSGATLKRVLALCKNAIEAQGIVVTKEYRWAIDHALLASQSWVKQLVIEATSSLSPLYAETERQLGIISTFTDTPHLTARLLSDLELTKVAVAQDIAVSLSSGFAERRRGLIKGVCGFISRLLSRW